MPAPPRSKRLARMLRLIAALQTAETEQDLVEVAAADLVGLIRDFHRYLQIVQSRTPNDIVIREATDMMLRGFEAAGVLAFWAEEPFTAPCHLGPDEPEEA